MEKCHWIPVSLLLGISTCLVLLSSFFIHFINALPLFSVTSGAYKETGFNVTFVAPCTRASKFAVT